MIPEGAEKEKKPLPAYPAEAFFNPLRSSCLVLPHVSGKTAWGPCLMSGSLAVQDLSGGFVIGFGYHGDTGNFRGFPVARI